MKASFALRRGFSLIEILVVMALLVALGGGLAAMYLGHGEKDAAGRRVPAPRERAESTVCQSNLQQLRASLTLLRDGAEDGKPPAALQETKFPKSMYYCPDGGEPYQYDPQTGQVHCVHPGHENL